MFKVVECTSIRELDSLRTQWGEVVERSSTATVFADWEWAEAFWKYSAPGKRPVILLAFDEPNGRLMGVLPLAQTRHLVVLRRLEMLGCDPSGYPMADYGGLIAERGVEGAVWVAMLRFLRKRRWSVLDLQNCATLGQGEESRTARFYEESARKSGWQVKVRTADVCRALSLPPTFQEYLSGLSSNSRQNVRRKMRKLAEAGLKIEQISAKDETLFNRTFEALMSYHQARWTADGCPGAFATERARNLHLYLAKELDAAGRLDLRAARASNGEIVGVIYNLRWNGSGYFYGLGVSQDEQYASLSLGTCLLATSISAAIEAGCNKFDLMRGDHDYKRHFGGYVTYNQRVTVYRYPWLPRAEEALRDVRARLRRPQAPTLNPALLPER